MVKQGSGVAQRTGVSSACIGLGQEADRPHGNSEWGMNGDWVLHAGPSVGTNIYFETYEGLRTHNAALHVGLLCLLKCVNVSINTELQRPKNE